MNYAERNNVSRDPSCKPLRDIKSASLIISVTLHNIRYLILKRERERLYAPLDCYLALTHYDRNIRKAIVSLTLEQIAGALQRVPHFVQLHPEYNYICHSFRIIPLDFLHLIVDCALTRSYDDAIKSNLVLSYSLMKISNESMYLAIYIIAPPINIVIIE